MGFQQDKRISMLSPPNHSTVTLPVTVRWKVTAAVPAARFAVFLDRAPQAPGRPLSALARDDRTCHPSEGCPDAAWFAQHNVYPTTGTSFPIHALPTFSKAERQQFHEVTVVLLDGDSRRIGESAFWVEFKVRSRSQA